MKKMATLLFLCIYLFSTTEVYQLLKIPTLFEHFLEHATKDNKLTFVQFIYMHYSQENDHDGDADKDAKLPFKSHSCSGCAVNFVPLIAQHTFAANGFTIPSKKNVIYNFYAFLISSLHLKAIWQPPQIC